MPLHLERMTWTRRPLVCVVVIAAVALALAVASTAAHGFPLPHEHDEYSYLLAAETFLHGRLTNPVHPMWRFFETFHVLQSPTYTSKYPPGNALFIAAGWKLTGHPIAGVWLSFVWMCVSLWWMLDAWIGRRWAVWLTIAAASSLAVSYWSYSYWGGAVAAGGGALLVGGFHRIVTRHGGPSSAALLALGVVTLAISRPYEGAVIAAPLFTMLGHWLWRERSRLGRSGIVRVVAPLVLVGTIGAAWLGYYNQAVTGSWHRLPYIAYHEVRGGSPIFIWQHQPDRPLPAEPTLRAYTRWEDSTYRAARQPVGRLKYLRAFVLDLGELVLPAICALPLLLLPLARRNRATRRGVLLIGVVLVGIGLSTYFLPHYAAPLVGVMLGLYGTSLQWLRRMRIGTIPAGAWLSVATIVLWFLIGVGETATLLLSRLRTGAAPTISLDWADQRKLIGDSLSRGGKRALIVVRYGATHGTGTEWVYNSADIDASPVVWARDLGATANRPLLDYFRDRSAWLIDVVEDSGPYRVTPYPSETR